MARLTPIAFHLLVICLILTCRLSAETFQEISVTYKLNGKEMTNKVFIPTYPGDSQPSIRGVMQHVNGPMKTFAYENQVALFTGLDEGRGFSKDLLAATAEATKRPEIEFAGAIVEGISKGGREAADWAAANQTRAIAVILDHSAIWSMDFPKRVSGVPMFFNETYADMYQNIDRRKSHFEWCSAAYEAGQPCTAIIDHVKNGGHGGRGSTELTALWLGEAMNLRVPANIPVGKAYQLIDVDPSKVGGYVSATLAMDGERSYHNQVKVTVKSTGANWWIPGPKSAALYLDWTKKNGGSVVTDESAQIKIAPIFLDLPKELARAAALVTEQKWGQAYAELQKSPDKEDHLAKTLLNKVNSNVAAHIELIKKLDTTGDVCGIYTNFQNYSKSYQGIPAYDEMFAQYGSFFKKDENKDALKFGREFYNIMDNINKAGQTSAAMLDALKKFAETHKGTSHGKAAQKAVEKLSADPSAKLSPESCFGN
jgi:hypothetical protein